MKELKQNGYGEGSDWKLEQQESGSWIIAEAVGDDGTQVLEKPAQAGAKKKAATRANGPVPKKAPAKKAAAAKQTAPAAEPVEPDNDRSPLPASDGPYRVMVDDINQTRVIDEALDVSRAIRGPVAVVNAKGDAVRRLLYRAARHMTGGRTGQRDPNSKRSRCATLLLREQGATGSELDEIVGRKVGEPFIHRLAGLNGGKVKKIAERHWQIVKA